MFLRRMIVVVALVLLSGCGGGPEVDWVQEGASLGRGLVDEGQTRDPANCERAVFEYVQDVGQPTGDDVAVMQRGCERG